MERPDERRPIRDDLTATLQMLAREHSDTGRRFDLDDVIASLGFDRSQLEAELDADLAAGRT